MLSIRIFFLLAVLLLLTAFSNSGFKKNNMEFSSILATSVNADFNKNNAEFIALLKDIRLNIVAPASGVSNELLSDLQHINSLNLNIPKNCFNEKNSLFHANSDEIRYKCLEKALLDDGTKVIWALRGGYGSAKLIHNLQKLKKPAQEKFFIGFSDITALHIFLTQEWGWKTIHGNGIVEVLNKDKDRQNFIKIAKIISGKETEATIQGLVPLNSEAKLSKLITGKLTGGNLTLVENSLATEWQIKPLGKMLFLEDVGIKPYQLDRSLYHLKQAGIFNQVNAIIFGSCDNDNQDIMNVLNDFASHLKVPVFKTNRFGHERLNDPIIYNTITKIIPSHNNQFDLIMKL